MRSTRITGQKRGADNGTAARLDKVETLLKRAQASQAKGQSEDAIRALNEVLKLAPENAQALFSKCQLLSHNQHYERLRFDLGKYDPRRLRNSVFSYLVGLGYFNLTQYDTALIFLVRAIELDPQYTIARLLAAETFMLAGKPTSSLTMLSDVPSSTLRTSKEAITYASILEKLGQHEQAMAVLVQLSGDLEVEAEALQQIIKLPSTFWPEGLEANIARLLNDTRTPVEDLKNLHFAAGRMADVRNDVDAAFLHFERANRLAARDFDPAKLQASLATVTGLFDSNFSFSDGNSSAVGATPVFIIGLPRAGKTLLESELAQHPNVATAGERDLRMFIDEDIFVSVNGEVPAGLPRAVARLSATKRRRYAEDYLNNVLASLMLEEPVRFITNTLPVNFWNAGVIRLIFPNARFVNVTRNGLDTGLACYTKNFRGDYSFSNDLAWFGAYSRAYTAMCSHWRDVLQGCWIDVSYESLVSDPVSTLASVLNFIGLDPLPDSGWWPVASGLLTADRIGDWKRYQTHLKPLLTALEIEETGT